MNRKEFLTDLTQDARPVKQLQPTHIRWSILVVAVLVTVSIALLLSQGFRPRFIDDLGNFRFFVETLAALLPTFLLSYLSIKASIPGERVSRKLLVLAFLSIAAYGALIVFAWKTGSTSLEPSMSGKRPYCFWESMIFTLLPILALSLYILKGYAYSSWKLAMWVALASAMLLIGFMQLACMYEPWHVINHHAFGAFIPALLFVGIGTYLLKPKY